MSYSEIVLRDYIDIDSGAAFSTDDFTNKGIPVLKIGNIFDYKTNKTSEDDFIAKDVFEKYKEHELFENDVLIAMSGNTTCKMGRVTKEFAPSVLNQRCGCIRIKENKKNELNIDYLYYLLISTEYQHKLWNLATATGQPNLSPRDIKRIKIIKPAFEEQIEISNILKKVDFAIESVNKSIQKAEVLKKSLIQNLLSGKISADGTKRLDYEIESYGKFGKKPKSWALKPIKECFDFITNATYSHSQLTKSGSCKYIHYGDIHTKFDVYLDLSKDELPFIENELEKGFEKLRDGDLVISDTSEDYEGCVKSVEIQNVGDNKVIAGLHTLVLRAKTNDFVNGFKGLILLNDYVRNDILRMVTGVKVYSISKSSMKKVLLPIPSKPEQEEILRIITSCLDTINEKRKKIEQLNRLKKSLMQNLLTGKMRLNINDVNKIIGA